MARPKLYRSPARLMLTLDKSEKQFLVRMAYDRGVSLSRMVVELGRAEQQRRRELKEAA